MKHGNYAKNLSTLSSPSSSWRSNTSTGLQTSLEKLLKNYSTGLKIKVNMPRKHLNSAYSVFVAMRKSKILVRNYQVLSITLSNIFANICTVKGSFNRSSFSCLKFPLKFSWRTIVRLCQITIGKIGWKKGFPWIFKRIQQSQSISIRLNRLLPGKICLTESMKWEKSLLPQ